MRASPCKRPLVGRICRAAAPLLGAVLTGCMLFGKGAPQPPCPRTAVVGDTQKVTQFRPGPGRDLTDIQFEGQIAGLLPDCDYDEDGFVDAGIVISMAFVRGPAAEGNLGRYEYFVAIADAAGEIIAKRVFAIAVEFPEAILRVGATEEITQRIYYAPEPDAGEHRIFVGFQLTQEQLDYIRSRR